MGERRIWIYDSLAVSLVSVVVSIVALSILGCGGEKTPGLGQVTGTVILDGKPVPDATVQFTPTEAGATASFGLTDAGGKYELYYSRAHKGAKVGEHSVTINSFHDTGESGEGQKELIPARYNVQTELKVTVKRGSNKFDFDLKGGGEVIQPNEEPGSPKKKKAKTASGCG